MKTVEAGLVTSFTTEFFNQHNKDIIDIFIQKMDDFKEGNSVLSICDSIEIGNFASINFCFDNTNLKEFSVDRNTSKIFID
jgi:hypothetical protein